MFFKADSQSVILIILLHCRNLCSGSKKGEDTKSFGEMEFLEVKRSGSAGRMVNAEHQNGHSREGSPCNDAGGSGDFIFP